MSTEVILALLMGVIFVGTMAYIFVDQRSSRTSPPTTISAPPSSDAAVNRATGALSSSDMPEIAPVRPATRRRESAVSVPLASAAAAESSATGLRDVGRDDIAFTPPANQSAVRRPLAEYLGRDGLTDEARNELSELGGGIGGRLSTDAQLSPPPITTRLPGDPDTGSVRRVPTTQPPIAPAMPARRPRHDRSSVASPALAEDAAVPIAASDYTTEPTFSESDITPPPVPEPRLGALSSHPLDVEGMPHDVDQLIQAGVFASPTYADAEMQPSTTRGVTLPVDPAYGEGGRVFRNVSPSQTNIEEHTFLPETRAQQPDRLVLEQEALPRSNMLVTWLIIVGLLAVLVVVGFWLFGTLGKEGSGSSAATDSQFSIVLANFGNDSNISEEFGKGISSSLIAAGLDSAKASTSCCISAVADDADAANQAQRKNADLLIWGDLPNGAATALAPHFYLHPNVALGMSARQGEYSQMLHPTQFALPAVARASMEPALIDFSSGLAMYYSDQAAPAADKFASAEARGLDAPALHFYRASSLLQMGDYATAISEFDHAGGVDDAAMLNNRGLAKQLQGDLAGASADYDAAIGQLGNDPKSAVALRNRALLRIVQGQFDTANTDLQLALAANKTYAPAWFDTCRIAFDINADPSPSTPPDAALSACTNALSLDPEYSDAMIRRGAVFLTNSHPDVNKGQNDLAAARDKLNDKITSLGTQEAQYRATGSSQAEIIVARRLVANRQLSVARYWMGRAYIMRGNEGDKEAWAKAIDLLNAALAADPNSYDANTWLAVALLGSGNAGEAAARFQHAKEIDPTRPSAYRQLAQIYSSTGQHDKAAAEYEGLLGLNPGYIYGYILLADEYKQTKQPDMEAATYQRCVQQPATTSDEFRYRGFAFDQLQDYPNAVANFEQALALNPKDARAYFYLATDYQRLGQNAQAIAAYQQAANLGQQTDIASYRAGVLSAQANNPGQAEKLWQQCVNANPQFMLCYYRLGQLAQASPGRSADAITLYNQALRADPKSATGEDLPVQQVLYDIHMQLGSLYAVAGDYPNAETHYGQALSYTDNAIAAATALCNVYIKESKLAEAQNVGDQMIKVDSNNGNGYSCKGRAFLASGVQADVTKAEQQLKQATSLNPNDVDALLALGQVYLAEGQNDYAEQQYRLALVAAPNSATAHVGLGDVLYARQQWDEAAAEYNAALQLDGGSARAYTGLAQVQIRQGQYDAATKNLLAAIKIDPLYAEPNLDLALLLTNTSRDADALPYYEQAVKLRPQWPMARYYLGVAYLRVGRTADATTNLQAAVQYQPVYPDAYYQLGNAYRAAGPDQRQQAINAYKQAVAQNSTLATAWYSLGLSYEEGGDRTNAIDAYIHARDNATDPALRRQAEQGIARLGG